MSGSAGSVDSVTYGEAATNSSASNGSTLRVMRVDEVGHPDRDIDAALEASSEESD
jgi:hypothetical protein